MGARTLSPSGDEVVTALSTNGNDVNAVYLA
jgi:hypothetical protein